LDLGSHVVSVEVAGRWGGAAVALRILVREPEGQLRSSIQPKL